METMLLIGTQDASAGEGAGDGVEGGEGEGVEGGEGEGVERGEGVGGEGEGEGEEGERDGVGSVEQTAIMRRRSEIKR